MARHIAIATLGSFVVLATLGCGRVVAVAPVADTQVLSLNPSVLSLQPGQPAPLTALATGSNGSTQDMTQQVAWQTSSPALSVSHGTATCDHAGDYTVTASTTGLSASAPVHCVAIADLKTVKGIQFVSPPAAILSNAPATLAVQAIYNDGSVADVTSQVSWTGDKVASISPQGIASCNGAGLGNISAMFSLSTATIQVQCFMKHRASHAGFVEHTAVFYGPFPSWLNLKTDFHAVGDGVADDTAAIRAGLAAAAQQGRVLYIPNPDVSYKLTDTLHLKNLNGITIVGQDQNATRIVWAGVLDGTALSLEGSAHVKMERFLLDGGNIGGVGIILDHAQGENYPTHNLLQNITIANFAIGALDGFAGETSVNRVHFYHNGIGAGQSNFNALNFNLTDCLFTGNNVGISNDLGGGAFNASHNTFVGSVSADMVIGNTAAFSLRDNVSDESSAFLLMRPSAAAAVVTAEGNVIRGMKGVPFQVSDPSLLYLVGNRFEAPVDAQQALVVANGSHPMQIVSMDNDYSTTQPFQGNVGTVQSVDEQPQANIPVSAIQVPSDVYMPPSSGKPVLEIPSQATAATIQQIVNEGAAMAGGAVVHFSGVSTTRATIDVPNAPNLALVGDGMITYLADGGVPQGNPVLRTHGAVQIEDIIIGASSTGQGIQVLVDDQPNSRVLCDDCTTVLNTNISVSVAGLDNAKVNFRTSQINGLYGFAVSGGANQASGRPGLSSVDAFMTTSNTFAVDKMGHFLISDGFHDGGQPPVVGTVKDGSVVTYDGGLINAASGIFLQNFSGVMSFLGVQVNSPIAGDSASPGTLGMVGTLNVNTSINVGSSTQLIQASAYSSVLTGTGLAPMPAAPAAVGDIEHLLAQARTADVLPREAPVVAGHVVHMRHVAVASGAVGFSIGPNPTVASTTTYGITDPVGTSITASSCEAGTVSLNGTWTLDPGNDGFYGLKGMTGYLGNVLPPGGGNGTLAFASQMTDASQRWLIEPTGDGTFTVTNRADGGVLARTTSGCAVISAAAEGSSSQKWVVSGAGI